VVIVATIALVIDVAIAVLTYRMSKNSLNIRAAFLRNVSDALASLGVIIAGSLIILYEWYWTDILLTLLIAAYVLYQAATMLPKTIHILMQGAPENVVIEDVIVAMESVDGVANIHHLHLWQLDEQRNALEAQVVIDDFDNMEVIKIALKKNLAKIFSISHSTLEFEIKRCREGCC